MSDDFMEGVWRGASVALRLLLMLLAALLIAMVAGALAFLTIGIWQAVLS